MKLAGAVAVVTGGAHGIGRALCRRFAAEGARGVIVADIDTEAAKTAAKEIDGLAVTIDVRREEDFQRLVARTTEVYGGVDLFCSNAGIFLKGGVETADSEWERIWEINVRAHIYAARAVLPGMLTRGRGYLLQTVSAAGLLTQIGSAPYAVTKHAAVAFAEWLAVTHGDAGITVSCLCPQGVRTRMLMGDELSSTDNFLYEGSVSPEEVADTVVRGIDEERFLILPHPEVAEYFRRKADDYDRWLRGIRRLRQKVGDG